MPGPTMSGSSLTQRVAAIKMSGSSLVGVGSIPTSKMSGSSLTLTTPVAGPSMQGSVLTSRGSLPWSGHYRYEISSGKWLRTTRYRYNLPLASWVPEEYGAPLPFPLNQSKYYYTPKPAMPFGDLDAHWVQVSAEDFNGPDFTVGTFVTQDSANSKIISTDVASLYYKDRIRMYQAGHTDTSHVGQYDPARFSGADSMITLNMDFVDGIPTGGHIHPVIAGQESNTGAWRLPTAGGRYDIYCRFNATGPHWGGVTFFISNGNFETDWSEGSSVSSNIQGFHHNATSGQNAIATVPGADRHQFHKYSVVYIPNVLVEYLLDDVSIKTYTGAAAVAADTVSFHFQGATDGTMPTAGTTATIDIDWMVVYKYVP